ncbi:hypothetical protein HZB97_01360 [Candidatus Gottesmanbacteria bacterium]|nr:hypothetical protein [Candidatus Gottesmanbacteria bacterium]
MTPVSRRPLQWQIKNDLINEFWFALGKLNRKEIELFLKDILSPTEIMILSKRIEILKKLRKKSDYSDIRDSIKVTDSTIAKMSEKLQKANEVFMQILDYLIRDENRRWEEFKESRKPHGHGKFVGGYRY